MPDRLSDVQTLAQKYAQLQHEVCGYAIDDPSMLQAHVVRTLQRCLPPWAVSEELVSGCCMFLASAPPAGDPMHTGTIHAYAGQYLLTAMALSPRMQRLIQAAHRRLPANRPASRVDLRLATLDALYVPGALPPGIPTAFVRLRLGLHGSEPLTCEEIALRMHMPLLAIHELESAILTTLSTDHTGGSHA